MAVRSYTICNKDGWRGRYQVDYVDSEIKEKMGKKGKGYPIAVTLFYGNPLHNKAIAERAVIIDGKIYSRICKRIDNGIHSETHSIPRLVQNLELLLGRAKLPKEVMDELNSAFGTQKICELSLS